MILDETLIFSDAQAVTASAASEQVVNQGAKGDATNALWLVAYVEEDFAGASKYELALETAADDAFSSHKKELFKASFAPADMKKGNTLFKVRLPVGAERYLRGNYTVTGTGTTGKVSLFLTDRVSLG